MNNEYIINPIDIKPLNLKEGQIVNSYKEMCEILEEPYLSSTSKDSQLSIWESFFEWRMKGRRFVIEKIYSPHFVSSTTLKNNSKKYYNDAQKILLYMLKNKEFHFSGGAHYVSISKLIKGIGLCNENYFHYLNYKSRYALVHNISLEVVEDFFRRSFKMFKNDTINILKSLENKAFIKVLDTYMITPAVVVFEESNINCSSLKIEERELYQKGDSREASNDEIRKILEVEQRVMESMGFNSIGIIVAIGRHSEFKQKVEKRLFKEHQILYHYKAFKIIFSDSVRYMLETKGENLFSMSSTEIIKMKKSISGMTKDSFDNNTLRVSNSRKEKQIDTENGEQNLFGDDYKKAMCKMGSYLVKFKSKQQLSNQIKRDEDKYLKTSSKILNTPM